MSGIFDLDAYFHRIGYAGPAPPDLATLASIHKRHVAAIAFENLDPFLGRAVALDLSSLQTKLVRSRRGGYCFEHNSLLKAALEALGYAVTGLAARVLWKAPRERPLGPRTHMLLRVDLADGPYIADVGFGHLLDAPLRLQADLDQQSSASVYRLTSLDRGFVLATHLPSGWQPMYQFGLETQIPADYEMANWYTSTNPQMWFTKSLLVQRLTDRARYTLHDRRLVEHYRNGHVLERTVVNAAQLAELLDKVFDLSPPESANHVFARLSAS